jgi:hypothetical protein
MTTQLNKETREYLIKLVAGISAWEYANGHDGMAERFNKALPNLILFNEFGDTILEDPQSLADFICQEYQDHITEEYIEPMYEMQAKMDKAGEVTVVKSNVTEVKQKDITEALEDLFRNDPMRHLL